MGACSIEDEWVLTAQSSGAARTIVLVGRTGNGKSATGNTILGEEVFDSKLSSSGVTSSCELQITVLEDGQMVYVIDTPGLFDASLEHNGIVKEIAKCIRMAKNGIHAVVLVLSVKARFTDEEAATIRNLQYLFGSKIVDYMIVLFTGGDELKGRTLDDFLGPRPAQPLKEILSLCNNRKVLFDNNTKDEMKRVGQVKELMTLVNNVVAENGGKPYTDDIFIEMQKRDRILLEKQIEVDSLNLKGAATNQELVNLKEEMIKSYDDQLKRITEMVEEKLRVMTSRLELEQAARLKAEEAARDEIRKLREKLEKSERETEELRKQVADQKQQLDQKKSCAIL